MKKLIKNILLASLLVTSLVSCGEATDEKKVAIFAYTDKDPFINEFILDLSKKISPRYKFDVFYGANSQTTQNKQIGKALNSNEYSAFIVNLVDRMATPTIVKKSDAYNLPLIFFNREPLLQDIEDSKMTYYVGSNGEAEGKAQADIIKNYFDNDRRNIIYSDYDVNGDGFLNTLLLRGETGHQDTEKRSQAVIKELNNFNLLYIGVEACDWSREKGEEAVRKVYQEEQIELIISNNDEMAFGAIDFYKKNKISNMPLIVGVNGTTEGKEAVDNGVMLGTVINDIDYQSTIISEITYDLVEEGKTTHDKITYSPTTVYVK